MVTRIVIENQVGKMGQGGIVMHSEKSEQNEVFAHGMDDAAAWVEARYPGATKEDMKDGRLVYTTAWKEYEDYLTSFLQGWEGVNQHRTQIVLIPANTIRVSTGFA